MSIANYHSSSTWVRLKELLVMGLIEWIPREPGMVLRKLLYPAILKCMGQSVRIYRDVEFSYACCIELGNQVVIRRNVFLDSTGQNNEILIGDRVYLDRNVRLSSAGHNSKIILQDQVSLDRGVDLKAHDNGRIEIGIGTYIGPYGCLAGPGQITIGRDCLIASHTGIYANNHNFADPTRRILDQGVIRKGIAIEDDCWLGTGVKVLDGVTIGRGSVIGAGAVVTKDIPPYSVAVGVPAKVISQRQKVHAKPVEILN